MRNDCLIFTCCLVGVTILPGCGRGASVPKTVAVHGYIRLDGKPVEAADVGFYCQIAGGRPATGKTNAEGRYSLSTFGVNDGAILGRHTVAISKFVFERGANDRNGLIGDNGTKSAPSTGPMSLASAKARSALPQKYSNPSESGLTVEVKPECGEINFDLTSR
jgi:hypothetical protein